MLIQVKCTLQLHCTKFQVTLKESMKIKGEKPDLNQQVKHIIYFDAFLIGTSIFGHLQSGASALYFNVETYYILIIFELSKRKPYRSLTDFS